MKKTISMLLAAALLLSLFAACGGASTPASPTDAAAPAPAATAEPAPGTIPEGYDRLTLYWDAPEGIENCDIWIWYGDKAGQGYLFEECDYGGMVTVDVPEDIDEVGFIVRRDCSAPGGSDWGSAAKDFEGDRFAIIEGRETEIYLLSGDGGQYKSKDGGKTLTMTTKFEFASIADANIIEYRVSPKTTISDIAQIKVCHDGRELEILSLSSLGKETDKGRIELAETLDISMSYTVTIEGFGEKTAVPFGVFDSQWFAENYHYEGSDLGAYIQDDTTAFKLWAPTASKVVLNLFESGYEGEAYKSVDMSRGDKGVWEHTEACGHGTYYTYTVTTAVGTQEAVDPYARAVGLNGERCMVVDLALTDPEGWEAAELEDKIDNYSEAIIWEVHVRDFSNKIEAAQYKGKYLAFTETGLKNEYGESVGIDYLKELGVTHVHLLPVYDYATVDEADPDSGFNWGYDPKNYNAPEGSYSTDPYKGDVRINEYKQMVAALHEAGIGVIMDMVYNHTYEGNSSFNKIVPYYYYRFNSDGSFASASGCGNDTASERYMFGKFMVESCAYWMEEYKLDGLRFDLMGLHDLDTMQEIESAVHSINPNAIIYGEGWTMGATVDGSKQANQGNISGIEPSGAAIGAVAVFNDVIRDGLKGSVFEKTGRGYINGAPALNAAKVIFGLRGGSGMSQGWAVDDAMVINYMSAHDNNTLWDKLMLSNGDASDTERCRMNKLGAAILMLAKGTPFWQAGEELLRSKGGDENSYKSSDEVNNIDWSVLRPGSLEYETYLYYKGLIEMRRAYDIFTSSSSEIVFAGETGSGLLVVRWDDGRGGEALAIINPQSTALPYELDGQWTLVADAERAGSAALASECGEVSVEALSVRVYVK